MINAFEIRNFRCFKLLKQSSLKRFNFIVGESGTGKTALLEALFLAGGANPEIWFRLRRWRGMGEGPIEINLRESYESLFRDMFYGYDQKQGAMIKIIDSTKGNRELEIFYESSEVFTLPLKGPEQRENAFAVHPITFKWDVGRRIFRSQVEIKDGALKMSGAAEVYPVFLISPQTFNARLNAQYYSNLSRKRNAGPILDAVKSIFPDVQEMTLEMVAGEPVLHVSLPNLTEKLPLGDLSGGITKYISIVIAILTNPGGVVMIDEIENGFYYKKLPDLLSNIVALCDEYEVQLFATTHSYEFLQVMADVIPKAAKREDEFSVLRLETGDQQPTIRAISGSSFEAAIKENFEVR